MSLSEDQFTPAALEGYQKKALVMARRRFLLSLISVLSGIAVTIAGVAVIFWPAALIVGGLLVAGYGAFYVDIPDPRGRRHDRGES